MMRWHNYITVGGLALVLIGCGKDPVVKEIRALRQEGELGQAREKTIDALQDTPGDMDLWLEFAQIAVEQTRASERGEGPNTMNYLVEATLVCGAIYKHEERKPGRQWRDVCRLASSELTKQANKVQTTLSAQASSAEYFKQLLETNRGDTGLRGAQISAARMVEGYKADARVLLYQAVVIRRLLELLPEVSPGSSTMLTTQIESATDNWRQSLELTADLTTPVQDRANHAVDKAMEQISGDLETLGYIIPGSIFENGITE